MEKKIDNKIEDNRGNIILENRKKMTLTGKWRCNDKWRNILYCL